jgi:hypothetical protein
VGEVRGSKETDGCPLTLAARILDKEDKNNFSDGDGDGDESE